MEPLSCLTVACTVVQFVDFGARVLSKGREFYLSHSGALARYEELQKDARQVNALVQVYSDQAKGLPAGVMAGMSNIIDECNLTAALLVSLLKDLHVQEKSGARGRFLARFFSSGKQAMRTVVKESQIEELNQKMLKLRSDIQGYVLAMIQ